MLSASLSRVLWSTKYSEAKTRWLTSVHARQLRIQVTEETLATLKQHEHCYHHDLLKIRMQQQTLYLVPRIAERNQVDLAIDDHALKRLKTAKTLVSDLESQISKNAQPLFSKQKQQRHLTSLRALDGRRQNHSYRQLAGALFQLSVSELQGWKTHDKRSAVIRLVTDAHTFVNKGYLRLLAR